MSYYKDKKVLVAGGAGFVGTNLILRLLELGARVRATIHRSPPRIQAPQVEWMRVNLLNAEDVENAAHGMEFVFVCAANTSGAAVIEKNPLAHVTPNVIMNARMIEAAYKARVKRYIWISSSTVYPVTDAPAREEEARGTSFFEKYIPVAEMKWFGEKLCEIYAKHVKPPMETVVVRPANMYGEYDDFAWETSHMVAALIRKVVERQNPIEVWGDGKDIKDLIYVQDFIEGLLRAGEKAESASPLNIGTGMGVGVMDVLQAARKADRYEDAEIRLDPTKPSMIPKRILDVSRAEHMLGFKAATTLEEGIRKTIEWYKKTYPNGYHANAI